jgi:predicted nuclease of predicted toxin-antitoxin system
MKVLVDMNLSPQWAETIRAAGIEATHWSSVGEAKAKDREILAWAKAQGYLLLTHDLDFGAILAAAGSLGPSVVQIRSESLDPVALAPRVIGSMKRFAGSLEQGAILTIEPGRSRLRLLPLSPDPD